MCKNNQSGFTLIEVVISMLLFAIISLISYNALQVYATHQRISIQHLQKINALQKTSLFIKRDINQVFNQEINLKNNVLTLVSLQNDEIVKLRYRFEEDNLLREDITDGNTVTLTLISGVKKIKWRLLNGKNQWIIAHKQKSSQIKTLELVFEHEYWGTIKQWVALSG